MSDRSMVDRLLELDRRWIFLVVAGTILIPVFFDMELPGLVDPKTVKSKDESPSKRYYDLVENLPEGAPILISADFNPGAKAELIPMLETTIQHALRKRLRVVVMTLDPLGIGMAETVLRESVDLIGGESGRPLVAGEDYVFMGWNVGFALVIIRMGDDFYGTFPKDRNGNDLKALPVMVGINGLGDFKAVVCITGSSVLKDWIQYGVQKNRLSFLCGCTGVMIPEAYPYMDTGQMEGLLAGMKGAAEYELATGLGGRARKGITAISFSHVTLCLLIIFSNILVLLKRRGGGK